MENEHLDPELNRMAQYLSGNLSAEASIAFEQWLAEDEERQQQFDQYRQVWELTGAPVSVNTNQAWENVRSRIEVPKATKVVPLNATPKKRNYRWAAAAAIAVLVTCSVFFFQYRSVVDYQAEGQQLAVALEDGSNINVNAGSSLTLDGNFNEDERRVTLKGEGFFEVAKNQEKPFIVHTDLVDVRVVGTAFNVKSDQDSVVVTVESGIVEVKNNAGKKKRRLKKGDRLVYRAKGQQFETLDYDPNDLAWKTRTLIFRRTEMKHVVEVLNHTYQQNVKLEHTAIASCKLTTSFEDQSFEEVLDVIAATFGWTIEETEEAIILKGETCH